MTRQNLKNFGGFSLIETMVAVGILTTGLTAALGLLAFTLRTVRVTSNALVAAHLAAEGVEVIRNLRDENWLRRDVGGETRGWRDDLSDGAYEVEYDTELPLPFYTEPGRFLEIAAGERYCYGCGAATIFKRKVEINSVDLKSLKQLRVTVKVSWTDQFTSRQVAVEDILYDWK